MRYLSVPLSCTPATLFVFCWRVKPADGDGQETSAVLLFTCKLKPADGESQETATVFVVVRAMVSSGAPGVCTLEMIPQRPPAMVKLPPLRRGLPA